jgi:hypothetical protein
MVEPLFLESPERTLLIRTQAYPARRPQCLSGSPADGGIRSCRPATEINLWRLESMRAAETDHCVRASPRSLPQRAISLLFWWGFVDSRWLREWQSGIWQNQQRDPGVYKGRLHPSYLERILTHQEKESEISDGHDTNMGRTKPDEWRRKVRWTKAQSVFCPTSVIHSSKPTRGRTFMIFYIDGY